MPSKYATHRYAETHTDTEKERETHSYAQTHTDVLKHLHTATKMSHKFEMPQATQAKRTEPETGPDSDTGPAGSALATDR